MSECRGYFLWEGIYLSREGIPPGLEGVRRRTRQTETLFREGILSDGQLRPGSQYSFCPSRQSDYHIQPPLFVKTYN